MPQPLKLLFPLGIICFLLAGAGLALDDGSQGTWIRFLLIPFPLVLAAIGGLLALNHDDMTTRFVEAGANRSRSGPMPSVTFTRAIGAAVLIVGIGLVISFTARALS
jgi:hypothetical protein